MRKEMSAFLQLCGKLLSQMRKAFFKRFILVAVVTCTNVAARRKGIFFVTDLVQRGYGAEARQSVGRSFALELPIQGSHALDFLRRKLFLFARTW
jgi:hypothetical protein